MEEAINGTEFIALDFTNVSAAARFPIWKIHGQVVPPSGVTLNETHVFNLSQTTYGVPDTDSNSSGGLNITQDKVYTQRLWGKHIGMLVICFMAVIGNSLLIFTIARHKHLRTTTNAFIMLLAMADLLFGFPTMPIHILAEGADGNILGHSLSQVCLVAMSMTSFQIVISVTTMFALTIERYMSIVCPLKHRIWSHSHCVIAVILVLWIYSALLGALPLMGWNALTYNNPWDLTNHTMGEKTPRCSFLVIHTGQYAGVILLHIMPVCLSVPFLYIHMFWMIRKFVARKISHGETDNQNERRGVDDVQHEQDQILMRKSSRRSLRLLVVIVIYFLCSWLPVTIWYCVATKGFTRTYMTIEAIENIPIPVTFYQIAVNLGFANSAINPYIYGLGNVRIRRTFMRMFQGGRFFGWQCVGQKSTIPEMHSLSNANGHRSLYTRTHSANRHGTPGNRTHSTNGHGTPCTCTHTTNGHGSSRTHTHSTKM